MKIPVSLEDAVNRFTISVEESNSKETVHIAFGFPNKSGTRNRSENMCCSLLNYFCIYVLAPQNTFNSLQNKIYHELMGTPLDEGFLIQARKT